MTFPSINTVVSTGGALLRPFRAQKQNLLSASAASALPGARMKILIIRTGAMGDILHTLPAIAALKHQAPNTQIDWVTAPQWQPTLTGDTNPYIAHTHLAETKQWTAAPFSLKTLRSILKLRKQLRAEHYNLVVDLQGTLRSAIIGRFASAENYAGYKTPREPLAARLYKQTFPRRGTHIVEMNTNLLADVTNLPLTPQPFALPINQRAEVWAANEAVFTRPLAVLAPGGGWPAKLWPTARYAELARRLKTMGFDVAVNAPDRNDPLANAVAEVSDHAARIIVSDVAGLIALLRRTDLFIGNDSGPTHLAAALAVPTIALFGPTNPARNGPWSPTRRSSADANPVRILRSPASVTSYKRSPQPDPHLSRIPVEDVLDAVWDLTGELIPPPENPLRQ